MLQAVKWMTREATPAEEQEIKAWMLEHQQSPVPGEDYLSYVVRHFEEVWKMPVTQHFVLRMIIEQEAGQ